MILRSRLLTLMLIMLFAGESMAAADEEMLSLLKELKSEIKALKSQAEQSNARISELEKQLNQSRAEQQAAAKQPTNVAQASVAPSSSAATPAKDAKASDKPAVTVGDIKGTFKIPGTDTSIGLGGFVKMDALFASTSAGQDKLGDQQSVYSQIPVGSMPGEHSQTTFVAKDSRLWFKSFTPSNWGDINTYVEFDFYGAPATYTYTPRLRHAYGSLGNFLAGQTWTTFTNTASIPDHLDSGVSAGAIANLRQPLIRWTQPFKWGDTPVELQAALESPRSLLWLPASPNLTTTDPNTDSYFTAPNADRYPDLVARLNYNPEWGSLSLAALGRNLRYTNNTTSLQKEKWGGGINLAGKINTVGLDNVRFMAHLGKGISRYITTSNTFEDAALSSTGNMQLVTTYGGLLSYQHWWTKQWRSSLTYGFSHADQPLFANGMLMLNQQVQSLHANLLWSPVSQTVMGVEYVYATRELLDGRNGDLHRIQFSARYNF